MHAVEKKWPYPVQWGGPAYKGGEPQHGYMIETRVPSDHPLAAEHGTLAGAAHVEDREDPDDPGGYRMHVHMVEVNPAYRRQGVGRALIEHAIKHSDTGDVTHDGFTPEGAALWKSITGEEVNPTKWAHANPDRSWRYACRT